MRYFYLALLVASVAMLSGCATIGRFVGGLVGGESDGSPEGALGGAAGKALGTFFPWFTTAVSTAGLVVEDIKRRKYVKAGKTLVRGIKKARDAGKVSDEAIALISREQDIEGVRQAVRKMKHEVENGG